VPGSQSQLPPTQEFERAADEAVLNKVLKNRNNPPFLKNINQLYLEGDGILYKKLEQSANVIVIYLATFLIRNQTYLVCSSGHRKQFYLLL
jgi:hypothetical protein